MNPKKLFLIAWGCFLLAGFLAVINLTIIPTIEIQAVTVEPEALIIPETQPKTDNMPILEEIPLYEIEPVKWLERESTAYNAGDPLQCDDTPCISADNSNICNRLANGEKLIASNEFKLGTRIEIQGKGIYTVVDRMNERYTTRIDIAMKLGQKPQAIKYGLKTIKIRIVE